MRKIKNIALVIMCVIVISLSLVFLANADSSCWIDEGKYDTAWLGDYDNTTSYKISNESQLAAFAKAAVEGKTFEGKSLLLEADINMSGNLWVTPYTADLSFLGTFDGNGYGIYGLITNGGSGAFLYSNHGVVKNLMLSISCAEVYSGGIAIDNKGSILNCAVMGNIGTEYSLNSGGICVTNYGSIDNSYSIADVKGTYTGGICYINYNYISNSLWLSSKIQAGMCYGNELVNSYCLDNSSDFLTRLSTVAGSAGYNSWTQDSSMIFGGFPVMSHNDYSVHVAGIIFDKKDVNMFVGDSIKITPTVYPDNATDKSLIWLSTNDSVAVVDADGNVTALKKGFATIRATTADGGMTANCFISVSDDRETVYSESISLNKVMYDIILGQNDQILYTIYPSNTTNKNVTFSVTDSTVATCDENGVITPIRAGSTVVSVKTGDGRSVASALIRVLEERYSNLWSGKIADSYAGGDGTKLNPYAIETPEQLAKLAYEVNSGNSYEGVYFIQKISIMLNDTTYIDWENKITHKNVWTPIGSTAKNPFKGVYDGGGYSINGVYINGTNDASGLFGYVVGGEIRNVNVKRSILKTSNDWSGGIVGFNAGYVFKCSFFGNVTSSKYTGGIVGYSSTRIDFCVNNGTVNGSTYVGGVVGYSDGIIVNSSNNGDVTGEEAAGGICGKSSSIIENCFNSGYVFGESKAGGIVGVTSFNVVNCYSENSGDGNEYLGQIAGYSDKILSSYYNSSYDCCGNLQNSAEFKLEYKGDGYYYSASNGKKLVDILNSYSGCIYSEWYFEWTEAMSTVSPTSNLKATKTANDPSSSVVLNGIGIRDNDYYEIDDISEEGLKALLSKINQSSMFNNTKAALTDFILAKNIGVSAQFENLGFIQHTQYRLTLPLDIGKIILDDGEINEYDIFGQILVVNVTNGEMYFYIPEFIQKTNEGLFMGSLKCIAHIVNGANVTNYGAYAQRFSFNYKDAQFSMSAMNTGEWAVMRIVENENMAPIETGSASITMPQDPQEPENKFSFDIIIKIGFCVIVAFGAVTVILVQRSRNNIRINKEKNKTENKQS